MKKEEDKKKKIYRYLDNLYSKSEVEDILKDIQNPEMQREVNKISLEMWEESISKPPFLHHTEQEKYKQEYYCIKSKKNNSDSENRYGEQLHVL